MTASSRDEVRIKAYSEVIPLRFEHVGNTIRVTTESGRYRRSGDQRMEVVVPFGTRVRANSVSGDVSVRGVRGEIEAGSVSGSSTVEDATRRASVSSVSGDARVRNVDGDVKARSVSGDIDVEGVSGEVDGETVSGEVEETVARVGGGAMPLAELPSFACAVEEVLVAPLREAATPVVGIVRDGRLLLDCRTIDDDEVDEVAAAVRAAR